MQPLIPAAILVALSGLGNPSSASPLLLQAAPLTPHSRGFSPETVPVRFPAFPGAEGFGAGSLGGRGGAVLYVTTLADDGAGSLREAVTTPGPRTVMFQVAGTIELASPLNIQEPFLTIAGQKAPGGGIALKNAGSVTTPLVKIETHDVVLRYVRLRPGPAQVPSGNLDALSIAAGSSAVIVDHCSLSWAVDEVANIFGDVEDVTIQWCILSEGLYCSNHDKTVNPAQITGECPPVGGPSHSRGMTISTAPGASVGPRNLSLHHNLWAHADRRYPNVTSHTLVDFRNNVLYNFRNHVTRLGHKNPGGVISINYVANYVQTGADATSGVTYFPLDVVTPPPSSTYGIWFAGNVGSGSVTVDVPQSYFDNGWMLPFASPAPRVQTTSALTALSQVMADSGATLPSRDPVDARIVADVAAGTGAGICDPADVGGWPVLAPGPPILDTDGDGMPNLWEVQNGLLPMDGSDGPLDADADGYTNLEEYLNDTDPQAP